MVHDTRDYGAIVRRETRKSSVVQRIIVYGKRQFSRGKERQTQIRLLVHFLSRIGDPELVFRLLPS